MAGAPSEVVVARQHKVLAKYLSPGGLGKHNAAMLAKELGVSERTIWYDLKKVREEWSKNGTPVIPDANTVQARIEAALSVAWEMVGEVDPETGGRVHDSETILKALDRVYKGIDLQAKVAGAYAAEKLDINAQVSAAPMAVDQQMLDGWLDVQERLEVLRQRHELGTLSPAEASVYLFIVEGETDEG